MSRYIDADKLKYTKIIGCYSSEKMAVLEEDIENAPTADVEPVRRGEWKERYYSLPLSDGSRIGYECSCCLTHWDGISNYCPYCGAKMDGKEAEG